MPCNLPFSDIDLHANDILSLVQLPDLELRNGIWGRRIYSYKERFGVAEFSLIKRGFVIA